MSRHLRSRILFLTCSFLLCFITSTSGVAIAQQLSPPPVPNPSASAEDLELQGDQFRAQKRFLDAIDFYNAALAKQPSALLWNKEGMAYLLLQRREQAAKCFDHAIKLDKHAPEGYNNRGYIEQMEKQYDKAIKVSTPRR